MLNNSQNIEDYFKKSTIDDINDPKIQSFLSEENKQITLLIPGIQTIKSENISLKGVSNIKLLEKRQKFENIMAKRFPNKKGVMKNKKSITNKTPFKNMKKHLDNVNMKNKAHYTQINLLGNKKSFIYSNISPARNPLKNNEDIKKTYYMDDDDLNKKEE